MTSFRKKNGIWFFRFVNAEGKQRERKGHADLITTKLMAGKEESEVSKIRNKLIDPAEVAFAHHEEKLLRLHLEDRHCYLIAKGTTQQHALLSRNRTAKLLELSKVDQISTLTLSKIQASLKTASCCGLSKRAIKAFSRWLCKDGRSRLDSLTHLTSPTPDADSRHQRRDLSAQEVRLIIQAAEAGPLVSKLTGLDRAMLYRIAIVTGFRANDLRTLPPERFNLYTEYPTITILACSARTENRTIIRSRRVSSPCSVPGSVPRHLVAPSGGN